MKHQVWTKYIQFYWLAFIHGTPPGSVWSFSSFFLLLPKLMLCCRQLFWSCLPYASCHFSSTSLHFLILTWSCQFTRNILHQLHCCLSSSFSVLHVHKARPVPPVSYQVLMRSLDDYTDYESSRTMQICITGLLSHISQYYFMWKQIWSCGEGAYSNWGTLNFWTLCLEIWDGDHAGELDRVWAQFFTFQLWRKFLSCRIQLTCATLSTS